jgi:hypothetical protein
MPPIKAFEPVAQSVEHVTFNHGVQGSNPCGLTSKIKALHQNPETFLPQSGCRGRHREDRRGILQKDMEKARPVLS